MALNQSTTKALGLMDVLFAHFAHGLTPTDLAQATGMSASDITRYVATLEAAGWAERIPETGRIRPSVRVAQKALAVLRSMDSARQRLEEIQARLATH